MTIIEHLTPLDVVDHSRQSLKHPTIVVAGSDRKSEDIADLYNVEGIRAGYLNGEILPNHRKKIVTDFVSGEIRILVVSSDLVIRCDPPIIPFFDTRFSSN